MSLWKYPIPRTSYIDETRQFHLTIADIKKLKKGDKLDIFCFDRNVMDNALSATDKPYNPKIFFEHTYQGIYTHDKGLKGLLQFDIYDDDPVPFEFDLEYMNHRWYPLKNGKLESKGELCGVPKKFNGKTWRSFPDTTRIGCRGPIVLKNHLDYMPLVYNVPIEVKQKVNEIMNR